jgi:hypothetical protein
MARSLRLLLILAVITVGLATSVHAGLRVGAGVHYLRTVGDLKDAPGFDENAFAFLGSLKYKAGFMTFEGDLEVIPDYIGSSETMWQPQAYALIGGLLYGGIGIGVGHLTDFGWQDPFYALRAGVDFMAGPLDLDVFASYRFQKAKDLSSLGEDDLNAITFGALITFGFSD